MRSVSSLLCVFITCMKNSIKRQKKVAFLKISRHTIFTENIQISFSFLWAQVFLVRVGLGVSEDQSSTEEVLKLEWVRFTCLLTASVWSSNCFVSASGGFPLLPEHLKCMYVLCRLLRPSRHPLSSPVISAVFLRLLWAASRERFDVQRSASLQSCALQD